VRHSFFARRGREHFSIRETGTEPVNRDGFYGLLLEFPYLGTEVINMANDGNGGNGNGGPAGVGWFEIGAAVLIGFAGLKTAKTLLKRAQPPERAELPVSSNQPIDPATGLQIVRAYGNHLGRMSDITNGGW
jgi:hypothetical protein